MLCSASFPNMVYDSESQAVIDKLWIETLKEFEFAGVQSILQNL